MEANEVAIIIGATAALCCTIAGTFLKYLNGVTKADRDERITTSKVNAEALDMLAISLKDNTESNREIARETKKSADEARQRNGHLAELMLENRKVIIKKIDCDFQDFQHIKKQEVDVQKIKVKE